MKSLNNILALLLIVLLTGCAVKTERQGVDFKKASIANSVLGVEYLKRGQNQVAMTKLKRALEYDDENANAHHYIAELYRRLKENELADTHFKKALDLAEDDSSLKNNYGIFLCGIDSIDEGVALFKEVLSDPLYDDKGQVYENMGICTQRQGNIKIAENYFINALKYNKNLPAALLGLAQIEFDRKNINLASSYLNRHNKIRKYTAQSLWLGILVERKSGRKGRAGSYAVKLKGMFPDSKETKLLQKMESRYK